VKVSDGEEVHLLVTLEPITGLRHGKKKLFNYLFFENIIIKTIWNLTLLQDWYNPFPTVMIRATLQLIVNGSEGPAGADGGYVVKANWTSLQVNSDQFYSTPNRFKSS
jgi:hypothetical protein